MSIFTQKKTSKSFTLPGKRLSGLISMSYLIFMLLIPLGLLLMAFAKVPMADMLTQIESPRFLAALKVTVWTAFVAAVINLVFGTILAWVQVRYTYWGKFLVTMLLDLPFALPTAVTGIALTAAFSQQSNLGKMLAEWGIEITYTPLGIVLAMVFIGIPFVVRQVEPILEELGTEMEQAAVMLGASPRHVFFRVILPNILPAAFAGFTAAFARGLGEYGSVIFISGNMPMKTEVVSLLIVSKLEQYDYNGAVVIAVVMLSLSLGLLILSNGLQYLQKRRYGYVEPTS